MCVYMYNKMYPQGRTGDTLRKRKRGGRRQRKNQSLHGI